jgi:ribosomal protein L33
METVKKKKYTIKLNNNDKIEQLLQETYDQACQQHKAIQEEINKLSSSTTYKDLDIDGKEKYGKIMNNFFTLQQKAIGQKFDIAKLMAEVVKHGGDVKSAIDASKAAPTTLDLDKLRKLALEASSTESESEEYVTKK